jgi:hypothetical protein
VLVVKISFGDEVGVVLAAAVGSNVPLPIGAGVVIATLTNFCTAWVLLTERAPRVVKHSLRQFLLFNQRRLERRFLCIRAGWEPPVITGVRGRALCTAIIWALAFVRELGVAVATLTLLVTVETLPSYS